MNLNGNAAEHYANSALENECATVASLESGNRNSGLNKAAFALGRLIPSGALKRQTAEARLQEAAVAAGLDATEAQGTIRSGLNAGAEAPRDISHVEQGAGRNGRQALRQGSAASASVKAAPVRVIEPNADAVAIWGRAQTGGGTLAEVYMRARGITGPLPLSLRFAPHTRMPDGGSYPAVIAAVTAPATGEVIAIQRTALRSDGSAKADIETKKAHVGKSSGGAVVLGDLAADDGPIIEGEGVETVLSVFDALGRSGIATLSQSTLGKPPLPPGRAVVILIDRGAEAAARAAAARRYAEGRAVRLARVPDDVRQGEKGTDANDVLRDRGPDAVREMIERAIAFRPDPVAAELPDGFRRRRDGWIQYSRPDDEAEDGVSWHDLCSAVEVMAATRDDENRSWGRLARVQTPDGQWGEIAIPMTWHAGDGREFRAALLGLGMVLMPGAGCRAALMRLFTEVPATRALCVPRLGWRGRVFVLPDSVFGDRAGERVIWQPETRTAHAYRVGGSLDGWRASVAALAAGNSRLVLALCTAFAAPLLTPLGIEGGGFHARGASSVGKTTMLRIAGSVWGGGGN